ncbi:hypothetical protein HME9302_01835 [Alteripontixanthobacter maritimus]|uniref:5-bromo-4-chloroindolyl phosphate hydrolysis protein n=1 Tax=Alteripontixanthobacter maritimus TaxID=2161824 RepID=A0A369Q6Y9_9SPHN|nr:hypothetical protein [Alteripontixanthobacter maritimus]RDC60621.1 hypothetical protein HME9302_01835 [Alteripontixanthobacter maritimus]
MGDLTSNSDRLIQEARIVRDDNRAGGRHRRNIGASIGAGSAALKRKAFLKTIRNLSIVTLMVLVGAIVVGMVINGLGFGGIVTTALVLLAAWLAVGMLGKVKIPKRAELNKGNVQQMVGRTELWLEAQRPALPAPAADLVTDMGVQLDTLGLQLEKVDQNHPAAHKVRKLVGEDLPEMIDGYRSIPETMRYEQQGGSSDTLSPTHKLVKGMELIRDEINSVNRQLAQGSIDDLSIRTRYLDYKYGATPVDDHVGGHSNGDTTSLSSPAKGTS